MMCYRGMVTKAAFRLRELIKPVVDGGDKNCDGYCKTSHFHLDCPRPTGTDPGGVDLLP